VVSHRRGQQGNPQYHRRSVTDDWIRALPRDKGQIYDSVVGGWESSLAMMSVALDDALSLRAGGEIVCAQQNVSVAAELFNRLSRSLVGFCESLALRGRYIRTVPLVEPLKTAFFRGTIGQTAATWNSILHHVAFGDRQRFVHKLKILSGTVEQLEREFDKAAKTISEASAPAQCWSALDHLHYDFTTCLREAEVVFKSFLRALPAEQLDSFAGEIQNPRHRKWMRLGLGFSRAPA
jgi:hypothetical protein